MKTKGLSIVAIAASVGLLMAGAPSIAQDDGGNTNRPPVRKLERPDPGQVAARARRAGGAGRLDRLARALALTDEQKQKIGPILDAELATLRELRQDSNLSGEQKREQFLAAREASHDKIKALLNTEQQEKWEKLNQRGRTRRAEDANRPQQDATDKTQQ